MQAIINYFSFVLEDGDYANDWLTHMPTEIASVAQLLGYLLALIFGL